MKKIALILFFVVLTGITVYSQVPEKINYQAVIRNSTGELVTDQDVGVKISVLDAASGGNVLYSEALASESLYFKKPSESYIFVFTTKYFKIWDSSGETKITINQ